MNEYPCCDITCDPLPTYPRPLLFDVDREVCAGARGRLINNIRFDCECIYKLGIYIYFFYAHLQHARVKAYLLYSTSILLCVRVKCSHLQYYIRWTKHVILQHTRVYVSQVLHVIHKDIKKVILFYSMFYGKKCLAIKKNNALTVYNFI